MKKIFIISIIVLIVITLGILFMKRKPAKEEMKKKPKEQEIKYLTTPIYIFANETELKVKLIDNSSSKALLSKLSDGELTIPMEDYGQFEKVGELGFDLPKNDKYIETKPGDLILYMGNKLTIYYDKNNWTFTKLGEIENQTKETLLNILGDKNIEIKIYTKENESQ